ncbi:MAG TPA: sigma-54 dependent transcriptional regulator [Candidatus Nitrosotenuis sp.]|jgi:DNA-binding NtrC family response regulator|nr:sigma-54 dependent transcriptional regulator [Candidatus Nitrosotenuis sp.]
MKGKSILLIDDDKSLRRVLEYQLAEEGYKVFTADSGITGLDIFQENEVDLIITDIRMPEMDGMELLKRIKAISSDSMVILITAYGSIPSAVEAMRLGASDYITKPFDKNELKIKVEKCLRIKEIVAENKYLREFLSESFKFDNMIGSSKTIREVYDIAGHVAKTNSTILIQGESGTGKELLAKAIHFNSPRCEKPFVVVNCGAIPENLLESELFGYKRGAFTGAQADKIGKFEAADGGTIFLDEVSELHPHLQVKMLRVLQDMEIDKIGDVKPLKVDVRVIAASNRNLKQLVDEKLFREDLYYRLSIIPITLPPLRERKEDIPLLANHFLNKFTNQFGKAGLKFDKDIFKVFNRYHWPGNIRQLENLIHRLVLLCHGDTITVQDLPEEILIEQNPQAENFTFPIPEEGIDLEKVEKELILQALKKKNWNQTQAAKLLNISRNSLIYNMQKYGITKESSEKEIS